MLDLLISLGLGVIYLAELIRWRLIQLDFFFVCVPEFAKCHEGV